MEIIKITNFGPIKEAILDLEKSFQVLIGEQASGKSTICKLIYFSKRIKDYIYDFSLQTSYLDVTMTNFKKYLKIKFIDIFGIVYNEGKSLIVYNTDDYEYRFTITDKTRSLSIEFDELLNERLIKLFTYYRTHYPINNFDSLDEGITQYNLNYKKMINDIIINNKELLYIPAGRSVISALSDKINLFDFTNDPILAEFITKIRTHKVKFGGSLDDLYKLYQARIGKMIKKEQINKANELMNKILHAEYKSTSSGDNLYYDKKRVVKLVHASSGQQEALWIILLIIIILLENKNYLLILEEPEAHLFPDAQYNMIKLISLLCNETKTNIILTTHSTYVLSSINLLLYQSIDAKKQVIEKEYVINHESFACYSLKKENGISVIENVVDCETKLVSFDFIDSISIEFEHLVEEMSE